MPTIVPAYFGAIETITAVIPWLGWPEKTQGVERLAENQSAFTADGQIEIEAIINGSVSGGTGGVIVALFVDDEQYCIDNVQYNLGGTNEVKGIYYKYVYEPGDTDPHRYSIRIGVASASTPFQINGNGTSNVLNGGAKKSKLYLKRV